MKINQIDVLRKELKNSDTLKKDFVTNPIGFLDKIDTKEPMKDKAVFLVVITIVGLVLLSSVVLGSIVIFNSKDFSTAKVPEFLVSIGSTALGALVGLLAPSPKRI